MRARGCARACAPASCRARGHATQGISLTSVDLADLALHRAHFGLPADFPMVHPDYAAARSALAKAAGLGQGGRQPKKAEKPARKPARAKA